MKYARLFGYALSSLADTTWRRLQGRPVADSWPFRFEWLWGLIRKRYHDLHGASAQEVRAAEEAIAPEPRVPVERIVDDVAGVDCEWFLPTPWGDVTPAPGTPAVVYLHGGGYVFGSTRTHADFLARLTRRTTRPILAVNYRLCPEHDVDDAVDDVVAVFDDLYDCGWEPDELALAGDSAGGGLAVSSSVALRDRGFTLPSRLALLSPWVDMRCNSDSYDANGSTDYMTREMVADMAEVVLDGRSPDDPVVSPLHADLAGLPPTLIHAGGAEVLLDDARSLTERLEKAGVEARLEVWPEMVHVFHNFCALLPEADEALNEIADFLSASDVAHRTEGRKRHRSNLAH